MKMSNYEYPSNLYYEPSNKMRKSLLQEDSSSEEEEKSSSTEQKSSFKSEELEPKDLNTKINASDDDDSHDLLFSSDDCEEEEFKQTKIKPPISINWEHIIKQHEY
mmetsp:Transcript_3631/g.3069  ORF Transcript_3631/g.3069 Transcript_3631/m.3069 type:complete len:106 (+) Transcript_3631:1742-2059(+)